MPMYTGMYPQAIVEVFAATVWVFPSVTWEPKATRSVELEFAS